MPYDNGTPYVSECQETAQAVIGDSKVQTQSGIIWDTKTLPIDVTNSLNEFNDKGSILSTDTCKNAMQGKVGQEWTQTTMLGSMQGLLKEKFSFQDVPKDEAHENKRPESIYTDQQLSLKAREKANGV